MKKLIFWFFLLIATPLVAQNALRFEKEVQNLILSDSAVAYKDIILFTGSSSIRLWNDMASSFPDHNVVNRGFGGSQMSDLLYYSDKLILPYKPKMIFIYEGDNDIGGGKSADEILLTADSLLSVIRKNLSPTTPVVFISPKPSIARWEMKHKYELFNAKLRAWVRKQKHVAFADVWKPMLDKNGNVMTDLFIDDNLHMNKKGYDIWAKVLRKHLK